MPRTIEPIPFSERDDWTKRRVILVAAYSGNNSLRRGMTGTVQPRTARMPHADNGRKPYTTLPVVFDGRGERISYVGVDHLQEIES